MKLNRKWLLLVALVLSVAMATTGTLAYLTDDDADVNTMVLGKVKIVQNEQQRVEDNGEFTSELEEFEQGKPLLPVTYPEGRTDDTVTVGDYVITLSDKEANYIDKIISVTNIGNSDAYVRTLVAVPTGGADWEPTPVAANNCWLHWNIPTAYDTYWTLNGTPTLIELDDKGYYVWEFTHKTALAADETTYPMVRGFYMDKKVDHDDTGYYMTYADGTTKLIEDYSFGEELDILVLSQAVQAAGFADATTALNEAFGELNATNAAEWFSGWTDADIGSPNTDPTTGKNDTNNPPEKELPTTFWSENADTSWFDASKDEFTISTAAELAGMAKLGKDLGGKTVTLDADIDLGDHLWTPINVFTPEDSFTFDGGNHTISNMIVEYGSNKGLFDGSVGTIKNVKIDSVQMTTNGRSGFVAGRHYGDIINCHVTNSVLEDDYWAVGGIVGMLNSGNAKDCTVTNVIITSNGGTGGIVGVLNESAGTRTIENCKATASTIENTGVYGEDYTGAGIVGMINIDGATTVNINNCTSSATLKGEYVYEIYAPAEEHITVNVQ